MSNHTAVKIPDDAYDQLKNIARNRHTKVETELIEAIEQYIESRREYVKDPFFVAEPAGQSASGDLAERHDKYLYDSQGE